MPDCNPNLFFSRAGRNRRICMRTCVSDFDLCRLCQWLFVLAAYVSQGDMSIYIYIQCYLFPCMANLHVFSCLHSCKMQLSETLAFVLCQYWFVTTCSRWLSLQGVLFFCLLDCGSHCHVAEHDAYHIFLWLCVSCLMSGDCFSLPLL